MLLWLLSRTGTLIVDALSVFIVEVEDHGALAALLVNSVFLAAKPVITRVRTHVLGSLRPEEEALAIRKSYKDSFNMIAVAAAISSQISITALSLPYIEEVHWTATAAFVASLIYGLFAIYFSCRLQLKLGSLHRGQDVLSWLHRKRGHDPEATSTAIPSLSAVMMLIAPAQLLNWSLGSFVIGIGIYYGRVFSAELGMLPGQNANLAILLVYAIATVGAAAEYFLPRLGKMFETYELTLTNTQLGEQPRRNVYDRDSTNKDASERLGGTAAAVEDKGNEEQLQNKTSTFCIHQCSTSTIEALTKVLQDSILLQEANLKAMQDLVELVARSQQPGAHVEGAHTKE